MKKLSKTTKNNIITYAIVLIAFVICQTMMSTGNMSSSLKGLLVPVCVQIILAISLNLTVGILGELSLGHAGFMCIGAFVGATFSKLMVNTIQPSMLRFVLAMILGTVVAAVFGFLIGLPVLRLKGDYLAIVTLAFGEIIKNIVQVIYLGRDSRGLHISFKDAASLDLEADGEMIIKGAQGITGTPRDASFLIGVILIILVLIVTLNLINSRDGRAIMAIRDNRIAAESVGINITKYKLMAFTISASIAGLAGVLYAHNYNSLMATSNKFGYNMSIMILVYVVLGGIGNIRGSIIAATILYILPEMLRGLSDYRMLIYSIVLIVMMLFNWAPAVLEKREKVATAIRGLFKRSAKEVR